MVGRENGWGEWKVKIMRWRGGDTGRERKRVWQGMERWEGGKTWREEKG